MNDVNPMTFYSTPRIEIVTTHPTMAIPETQDAIDFLVENRVLEKCVDLFRKTYSDFVNNRKVDFTVKVDGSLVSSLELEIEKVISEYLSEKVVWAGFQGEEGTNYLPKTANSPYKWYLDPIDGTISFKNGLDTFAFTLTLVVDSVAVATIIDFPKLDKTFTALKNRGAKVNNEQIQVKNDHHSHALFAISDDYTYKMTDRQPVLDALRSLPFVTRTITDIHAYTLVAEGKCLGKFDAAGALWDLWPGHLLITEAGGICLFFPTDNPTEDLAGSMLIGHENTVNFVLEHLNEKMDQQILPQHHHKPF